MAEVERRGGRLSRRALLRAGGRGVLLGAAAAAVVPRSLPDRDGGGGAALAPGAAPDAHPGRILIVVELSGGNDGLDTFVPYRDDAYHRARPTLRRRAHEIDRLDHDLAMHRSLEGLLRLWSEGRLAVVEGCGHRQSSRSHFAAAAAWHTGAPSENEEHGWIGRLADSLWSAPRGPVLVNVATKPSPALRSRAHAPFVFSDPERLASRATAAAAGLLPSTDGVRDRGAGDARAVRDAVRHYRTPIEYGASALGRDLRAVAALVGAGFPARVYYASAGGFDTHASQADARPRLLRAVGDSLHALERDLRRLGRDPDVATLVFSEFGRRLEENASRGTDHGTAGPVLLAGGRVAPGLHGARPSLEALDPSGDPEPTTDFRRVYASVIEEWFGWRGGAAEVLPGDFAPLGLFA